MPFMERNSKHIIDFAEMRHCGAPDAPSITSEVDFPRGWDDPEIKEMIVAFLASSVHPHIFHTGFPMDDAFTGKPAACRGSKWQDELHPEYIWTDETTYYVDNYDVRLPDDFVSYVLERYRNGFDPGDVHIAWKRGAHPENVEPRNVLERLGMSM